MHFYCSWDQCCTVCPCQSLLETNVIVCNELTRMRCFALRVCLFSVFSRRSHVLISCFVTDRLLLSYCAQNGFTPAICSCSAADWSSANPVCNAMFTKSCALQPAAPDTPVVPPLFCSCPDITSASCAPLVDAYVSYRCSFDPLVQREPASFPFCGQQCKGTSRAVCLRELSNVCGVVSSLQGGSSLRACSSCSPTMLSTLRLQV